jgi:putative ATP-dependent endonuclease of the OLD family
VKLARLRIENFRAIRDQTIHFNDYTCLVGPNGAGKSTILNALNVFFREQSAATNVVALQEEDFFEKDTTRPVKITLTFKELSEAATSDFSDYYRQGELTISAIAKWDAASRCAEVAQHGVRLGVHEFRQFFAAAADGDPVPRLQELYSALKSKFPELPTASTKPKMLSALRAYEAANSAKCIPIESRDQFYGISRGTDRLQRYVQWVFIPAVKDASAEQIEHKKTALAQLLERTVRGRVSFNDELTSLRREAEEKFLALVTSKQSELSEVSQTLAKRLRTLAHGDTSLSVEWQSESSQFVIIEEPVAQVFAQERGFKGALPRFGHGLQRAFLIALLQELASGPNPADAPTLILGCEEPELFQHPPQAKHLASVLERLSEGGAQIIVCTHSPHLISGRGFEDVRMVRRERLTRAASVRAVSAAELRDELTTATGSVPISTSHMLAKLESALHPVMREMFFADVLIFVESNEDVAAISTYMHLTGLWDEFRRLGCHFIPAEGKSKLLQPLIIARRLEIPAFLVFDSDSDESHETKRQKHARDNAALTRFALASGPVSFLTENLWAPGVVVWRTEIQKEVESEVGRDRWLQLGDSVRVEFGLEGVELKNPLFLASRLEKAWNEGVRSPSLQRLCNEICGFARAQVNAAEATPSPVSIHG